MVNRMNCLYTETDKLLKGGSSCFCKDASDQATRALAEVFRTASDETALSPGAY